MVRLTQDGGLSDPFGKGWLLVTFNWLGGQKKATLLGHHLLDVFSYFF